MRIYDENGWLNIEEIMKLETPFIFILGERACGKTYGFIRYMMERKEKFLFMRRTQTQSDLISKQELTPIKSVADDMEVKYTSKTIAKGVRRFYFEYGDEVGEEICTNVALSTFGNLNGFDATEYHYLFFDEFIARPTEKPLKEEAELFFHAYETINRNRELKGMEPLKCVLAANSFNVANALFLYLGIVNKVLKMKEDFMVDKERGFSVIFSRHSAIAEKKKNTALYNLVGEQSDFSKLSLESEFMNEQSKNIKRLNVKEFKLLTQIGEIAVYKHKSRGIFYVSTLVSGVSRETFRFSDMDMKRFKKNYLYLWWAHLDEKVYFETFLCQVLFEKAFGKA